MPLNIGTGSYNEEDPLAPTWFRSEDGNLMYGIPGQQPIYEYDPSTGELWNHKAEIPMYRQVPKEILAEFPGAKVVDVTRENFPNAFKDDFAGQLGDYLMPAAAALVGGGMIAPWAAAGGAGAAGGSLADFAGYGGAFDPAVGAGAFDGLGGVAGGLGEITPGGMDFMGELGAGEIGGSQIGNMAGAGVAGAASDPGSFLNADGTYGSTAANSGVGGAGAEWGSGAGTGTLPWMTEAPAAAGAGTALSRLLDGTATTADYLSLGGNVAGAGLSALAGSQQAGALTDLANKYAAYGEPSRGRYEASFAPGFTMEADPGYTDALNQAAKGTLHGLSAKFGNPAGSPNAWAASLSDLFKGTAYPALQNYRAQNANAGGISTFTNAVPGLQTGALGATNNIYGDIARGAANIFNPVPQQMSLADLFKQIKALGG